MFKFVREAKARMQIGPMIEQSKFLLVHNGIHMTPADWDDPYLFGYFAGSTWVLLKAGSEGKLEGGSVGVVQAWGWEELTTLPGRLYSTRTISYSPGGSDDWKSGSDNGMLYGLLLTGHVDRSKPRVAEAIEASRDFVRVDMDGGSLAASGELQNAAAYVYYRDWYRYIVRKKRDAA